MRDENDVCQDPPVSPGPAAGRLRLPDSVALRTLAEHTGDRVAVDHFVSDFLAVLPDRVQRLGDLVADNRSEAAETLVLSLTTSARMIGADDLAGVCERLRGQLIGRIPGSDQDRVAAVADVGAEADALLALARPRRQR